MRCLPGPPVRCGGVWDYGEDHCSILLTATSVGCKQIVLLGSRRSNQSKTTSDVLATRRWNAGRSCPRERARELRPDKQTGRFCTLPTKLPIILSTIIPQQPRTIIHNKPYIRHSTITTNSLIPIAIKINNVHTVVSSKRD